MPDGPLIELQDRVLTTAPSLPRNGQLLFSELRKRLMLASRHGELETPIGDVYSILKQNPPGALERIFKDYPEEAAFRKSYRLIVGGPPEARNFHRDPDKPHFRRPDGAWFDFSVSAVEQRDGLEMRGYSFEIRFPAGTHPKWLRLDLNFPGHTNENRAMRCHLHPGNDDLQVPAPLMHPLEALELFLTGLQLPSKQRV